MRRVVWAFSGPVATGQEAHAIIEEQVYTTQEAFCGATPAMMWNTAVLERAAEKAGEVPAKLRTKTPPRCRKCASIVGQMRSP